MGRGAVATCMLLLLVFWGSASDLLVAGLRVIPAIQAARKSLQRGNWVKFISGASNEDLPLVRNLCFIYALSGVDCIDVSSNPAVVLAAKSGVDAAFDLTGRRPLLMISINDGEDSHFRKAQFDPSRCPPGCPRPCERVCPAWAINTQGVNAAKCYGCGRCLSACPRHLISTIDISADRQCVVDMLNAKIVDAVEIHTNLRQQDTFASLWAYLAPAVTKRAALLSISFNDIGASTWPQLNAVQRLVDKHGGLASDVPQVWQVDGRSMSGDLGKAAAGPSIRFGKQLLQTAQSSAADIDFCTGRHFLQLAGGTNDHSSLMAERECLLTMVGFGGFAFGGYARKTLSTLLLDLSSKSPDFRVEDHPSMLQACLGFANALVGRVKRLSGNAEF